MSWPSDVNWIKTLSQWKLFEIEETHMSDLRPSCSCGKIIWTEWESFVFGIGWLIIAIARATFPIFLTYSQTKKWTQSRRAVCSAICGSSQQKCYSRKVKISLIKVYCPLRSSPHPTPKSRRVAFSRCFGYFAKKTFMFLEITSKPVSSKQYNNHVLIFFT